VSSIGKVRADLDYVESEMMQKDIDIAELKAQIEKLETRLDNLKSRIEETECMGSAYKMICLRKLPCEMINEPGAIYFTDDLEMVK
jgi:predicted  nucleic acid-binding Zn-ribbon protein